MKSLKERQEQRKKNREREVEIQKTQDDARFAVEKSKSEPAKDAQK